MEKGITIQDIASMAGVSKSTVSRYLNEGYISREKSAAIRKAIEDTGFESNFFARRLKAGRSKLIGIVLPRVDSVTAGKLLAGFNAVLEPAGYQGILLVSDLQTKKEVVNMQRLVQQGVDGIIVDSVGISKAHRKLLETLSIPVVFTGQKQAGLHYIKLDDYGAGHRMGVYMQAKGHQRVVFAGVTESDQAVGIDRKKGFVDGFCAGNPGAEVVFVQTGFDFASAYDKGSIIMDSHPTAVICATDNIGLGILRYLHEQGIHVPEQVSLAGFGGYDVGAVSYPALTTVVFDYRLLGMKTAQGLLQLLHGEEMHSSCDMPMFLIERESVRSLCDE